MAFIGSISMFVLSPLLILPGIGTLFTMALSLTTYGIFVMASSWDEQIKEDMDRIGWNPFNTDPDMSKVNKVSFYKGQPVMINNIFDSSFSFGIMFLKESQKNDPDTVKHEWGHFFQMLILGPLLYSLFVAVPSVINFKFGRHNYYTGDEGNRLYYSKIWERTADMFGGVDRKNYDPISSGSNFIPW